MGVVSLLRVKTSNRHLFLGRWERKQADERFSPEIKKRKKKKKIQTFFLTIETLLLINNSGNPIRDIRCQQAIFLNN